MVSPKVRVSTTSSSGPYPFSQGVRKGPILQVAGQSSQGADGGAFGDDVGEQTMRALDNVRSIVEAAGGRFDDVIALRVFLTDRGDFPAMNAAYEEFLKKHVPSQIFPARTTVFVGLPLAEMLVEIDGMAVLA